MTTTLLVLTGIYIMVYGLFVNAIPTTTKTIILSAVMPILFAGLWIANNTLHFMNEVSLLGYYITTTLVLYLLTRYGLIKWSKS